MNIWLFEQVERSLFHYSKCKIGEVMIGSIWTSWSSDDSVDSIVLAQLYMTQAQLELLVISSVFLSISTRYTVHYIQDLFSSYRWPKIQYWNILNFSAQSWTWSDNKDGDSMSTIAFIFRLGYIRLHAE